MGRLSCTAHARREQCVVQFSLSIPTCPRAVEPITGFAQGCAPVVRSQASHADPKRPMSASAGSAGVLSCTPCSAACAGSSTVSITSAWRASGSSATNTATAPAPRSTWPSSSLGESISSDSTRPSSGRKKIVSGLPNKHAKSEPGVWSPLQSTVCNICTTCESVRYVSGFGKTVIPALNLEAAAPPYSQFPDRHFPGSPPGYTLYPSAQGRDDHTQKPKAKATLVVLLAQRRA